jgi:ADP-L-glycero-D-manno-heptose 6-epimerase
MTSGKSIGENMAKVLVTGGGGFIGRNLTERLVKDGHETTITSTGSEPTGNVQKVLYHSLAGIDWKSVRGMDVVFHQMANNDTRCLDREEMYRTNVRAARKLFEVALDGGCKKFVYASSTAVYGNAPAPYTEDTPIQPLNPYAESKAAFDDFAMDFAKENNVSVIGLRYCNVYGPGESHKGKRMSMIGQILRKMLSNEEIVLFKDGTQKRDWAYIKDVVDANILASESNRTGIYNIGAGGSWSFNEVFEEAWTAMKIRTAYGGIENAPKVPHIKYIDCPFPESYQSHTECCIEKASRELGYSPKYDIKTGIREYFDTL